MNVFSPYHTLVLLLVLQAMELVKEADRPHCFTEGFIPFMEHVGTA